MGMEIKQKGALEGKTVESSALASELAFQALTSNASRELVSVPPSVLESMALAIQQLTEKANLLGAENAGLRGELEGAQRKLAEGTKKNAHVIEKDWTWSTISAPKFVQRLEAAAEKFGLTDRTVTWRGNDVSLKVRGATSDVAKLQEWGTYWSNGGANVP